MNFINSPTATTSNFRHGSSTTIDNTLFWSRRISTLKLMWTVLISMIQRCKRWVKIRKTVQHDFLVEHTCDTKRTVASPTMIWILSIESLDLPSTEFGAIPPFQFKVLWFKTIWSGNFFFVLVSTTGRCFYFWFFLVIRHDGCTPSLSDFVPQRTVPYLSLHQIMLDEAEIRQWECIKESYIDWYPQVYSTSEMKFPLLCNFWGYI